MADFESAASTNSATPAPPPARPADRVQNARAACARPASARRDSLWPGAVAGATLGGMSHAHRADHRPLILAAAAIAVLGAALAFQYIGGFPPCEMCHWQRWPWMAAIALAVLAALVRGGARRWLLTFGG